MEIGQWMYSFMGNRVIKLKVTGLYDDYIAGEDVSATYCFYRSDCYNSIDEAIDGMILALERIGEMRIIQIKANQVKVQPCDCGESEDMVNILLQAAGKYVCSS